MGGPTYFGVRHLSPGAAFHLRRTLDAAQPGAGSGGGALRFE